MGSRLRWGVVCVSSLGLGLAFGHVGCFFNSANSCADSLGFAGCGGASGGGSTTSGSGGGAHQHDAGHDGGPHHDAGSDAGCTSASTCPQAPPGPCHGFGVAVCTAGVCSLVYTPTPTQSQTVGSCVQNFCTDAGALVVLPDPSNVYPGVNPCMNYGCDAGDPTQSPKNPGDKCTANGDGGTCVLDPYNPSTPRLICAQCVQKSDCGGNPSLDCSPLNWSCVAITCTDTNLDPNESDLNCGGPPFAGAPACARCATGKVCKKGSDCESGICTNFRCAAPACDDHVWNGLETDQDCGGPCPTRCPDSATCQVPTDCLSGVCLYGTCQTPTCTDGTQNGTESDVDCGGQDCPRCWSGHRCSQASDCVSGICSTAAARPTCQDAG